MRSEDYGLLAEALQRNKVKAELRYEIVRGKRRRRPYLALSRAGKQLSEEEIMAEFEKVGAGKNKHGKIIFAP
ncbi:MAG: hypothetical protein V1494_07505 [Candidatus Diapherotrites archaeon]